MLPAAYVEGKGSRLVINPFIPVGCTVALTTVVGGKWRETKEIKHIYDSKWQSKVN